MRKLGDDDTDGVRSLKDSSPTAAIEDSSRWIAAPNPDGVVREVKEKRVISREEIEEVKETEDVQHFGDITDEVSWE